MAKILLMSSDGRMLEVDSHVAAKTMKIKNFDESDCDGRVFPVLGVRGEILAKVINFCVKKLEFDENKNNDYRASVEQDRKIWNAGFFCCLSRLTLLDLIVAGKDLEVDELFERGCEAVASMLKDMSAREIRGIFK